MDPADTAMEVWRLGLTTVRRLGLGARTRDTSMFDEDATPTTFRRPDKPGTQLSLF